MKLFSCALVLLAAAAPAQARCAASATYRVTLKAVACDEKGPGELFIRSELLEVARVDDAPELGRAPIRGRQYVVYRGLSPLVDDGKGGQYSRPRGSCKKIPRHAILKSFLARPCCDADYPYCGGRRRVDFILHSRDDEPVKR